MFQDIIFVYKLVFGPWNAFWSEDKVVSVYQQAVTPLLDSSNSLHSQKISSSSKKLPESLKMGSYNILSCVGDIGDILLMDISACYVIGNWSIKSWGIDCVINSIPGPEYYWIYYAWKTYWNRVYTYGCCRTGGGSSRVA